MKILIGVTGTHSTGKTTFIDQVLRQAEQRNISARVISDTATRARDAGFPILRDHTFESTLWIMAAVIKAELDAGLEADLVLVDRPVPDALGYLEAALSATHRSITEPQRSYLFDMARHHAQRYSLLLKTTLDESIPLGKGRDGDLSFRRDADRHITKVLDALGIPHLDPNSGVAVERLQSLLTRLT